MEAYDELGNRYVVPKYCISKPTNMAGHTQHRPHHTPQAAKPVSAQGNEESHDSTTNLLQDSSTGPVATAGKASSASKHKRSKAKPKTKSSRGSLVGGQQNPPSMGTQGVPSGDPVVIKVRLSTLAKDIKMTLQASDRVRDVKKRLEIEQNVQTSSVTMLYGGRVLNDRIYIKNLEIPKGFVIQAIVA